MQIGDRIRRTLPRGTTDIKIIKNQSELDYFRSLEPGVKIEILPEIPDDGVCVACEG